MSRETNEERAARARRIVGALARAYPDARTALAHRNAFELLIATILSAQCTDEKVNEVTAELFSQFPDAKSLAEAPIETLEQMVHSTGFYRQKAKSIHSTANDLVHRFGGEVPRTLDDLVSLRGVARKTANVVLGNCFGEPALAIDTHMKRVHRRLGLTAHDDPLRIERDLMELIPRDQWVAHTHRVIDHGRAVCTARRPRCADCVLVADCLYEEKNP